MGIDTIESMNTEMFDAIAKIRAMREEDRIRYMVCGDKTTDGKPVFLHEVTCIDCEVATGTMVGFTEHCGGIFVEVIPRELVLYRV